MEALKLKTPAAGEQSEGTFQNEQINNNTTQHPYLEEKGIDLAALQAVCPSEIEIRHTTKGNFSGEAIFRELLDAAGTHRGFERILSERIKQSPDDKKGNDKFVTQGGTAKGTFTPFGFHPFGLIGMDCRIIVCAGLAEGYRIHEATGEPVACGVGDGVIRSIVEAIQPLNPNILVAVDNDDAGKRAGKASGCKWTHPTSQKDWSDVYQIDGLDSVLEQLAVEAVEVEELEPVEQFGSTITKEAQKIANFIQRQLMDRLQVDPDTQPDEAESLKPDAEIITRMINGAFWSGGKSKVFLLNHSESLIQFTQKDSFKFLTLTFGNVIDKAAVTELAKFMNFGCTKQEAEEKARAKHISGCMGVATGVIIDHLKYTNQRESIEWRVDMFAKNSRMELLEDKARIVLTHRPLPTYARPEGYAAIIADYKEHFTRLDDLIKFIVAARFVRDRKKAYLWILADSDWGKGFIIGILKEMGCCVETSMKEVEAMLEGKPVGRSAEDFKRAFVLLIDEFKTVKSELKQLQSEISLSPKNQLTCTVEVFAKLFTSAESVDSLVTENGVEDQFANRMSIFQETGDITARALYKEVGNSRYFLSVLSYTANLLNLYITNAQMKGRPDAEAEAETWLNDFMKRYGLDTLYERFSDTFPALAADLVEYFTKGDGNTSGLVINDHGAVYLRSPAKALDDYLGEHYDQSQITAFRKKKNELIRLMSVDGAGNQTHRINGQPKKAVKLKD